MNEWIVWLMDELEDQLTDGCIVSSLLCSGAGGVPACWPPAAHRVTAGCSSVLQIHRRPFTSLRQRAETHCTASVVRQPAHTLNQHCECWIGKVRFLLSPADHHRSTITRCRFDPHSQRVATVSADRSIKLWDLLAQKTTVSIDRWQTHLRHFIPL